MSLKKMNAEIHWQSQMHFECINNSLISHIDATADFGGQDLGPTPKELVLNAMMGCTSMDVLSLLKKMRQELKSYGMTAEAEMTEEHPIHFKSVEMVYNLEGVLDIEKVKKSVESSMTKYCGVNYMLSQACPISYKVMVNGDLVHEGQTKLPKKSPTI